MTSEQPIRILSSSSYKREKVTLYSEREHVFLTFQIVLSVPPAL